MADRFVLDVENLRKSYPVAGSGQQHLAVNDVSLRIARGEIYAFLGPNGAGKTTTIKMICGLLEPSTGSVRICGLDPFRERSALGRLGAVLEGNRNLYWRMTCYENLLYFGVLKGMTIRDARQRADELLTRFQLAQKRNAQVQALSRGMQQKLAIASSVMHAPSLLLLDEPTLGLDAQASIDVTAMVRELTAEGVAILLTTHQLDVAEALADRVGIMAAGRIIKEAATQDLLHEYAKNIYEIQLLDDPLPEHVQALVQSYRVSVDRRCVQVACEPDRLYDALALLRPAQVHSIKRHQSDLASIFISLTQQESLARA